MKYFFHETVISLKHTFECGQCFRWKNEKDSDTYIGVVKGMVLRAELRYNGFSIDSISGESEEGSAAGIIEDYFDIKTDYETARAAIAKSGHMRAAADYSRGLRLLRQEPFETLISFIISQCNNIPRIKQIIEKLCITYGKPIGGLQEHGLEGLFYSFPPPQALAGLREADLAHLKAGYRASYIIEASNAAASGKLDLKAISGMEYSQAISALREIRGIGPKVAACTALYGLGFRDAFPIDTWMKKALKAHFPPDFDPSVFSPNQGLAQQYIFYYERSTK